MATSVSRDSVQQGEIDPFGEGWLTDQLGKVVTELASRPTTERPQLTGERAETMSGSAWLAVSR